MPEGEGPRFERARRGFPIGIAIIREGTYGPPISSRNVYADELTPEELADRERQGLGYPQAVEIERLTRPTSAPVESPSADQIAAPNEPSDQADPLVKTGRAETELLAPSGDSVHIRHAAGHSAPDPSLAFAPVASYGAAQPVPAPDLSRHARRCLICAHPDRDAIEGDFVRWRSPERIAKTYQIADRSSIYRHAHCTGLFERRKLEVGRVLESILENVEHCPIESADLIVRAARLYTHLNDRGQWVEAPRVQYRIEGPPPGLALPPAPRRGRKSLRPRRKSKSLTATDPNSKNP
jgi:hypothetical protein